MTKNIIFKQELIEKYLYDIYNNKYPKIAKETGRDIEDVKETVKAIQRLNPKPRVRVFERANPFYFARCRGRMH